MSFRPHQGDYFFNNGKAFLVLPADTSDDVSVPIRGIIFLTIMRTLNQLQSNLKDGFPSPSGGLFF